MENAKGSLTALAGGAVVVACLFSASAEAGNSDKQARRAAVVDHWNAERRAAAQPRDMVIDQRGLGYLRRADGSLHPHGHKIEATGTARPSPQAKPGGGGGGGNDTQEPSISNMNPADGDEIGDGHTFSAVVTDNAGVRSVTFIVTKQGGSPQSFSASNSGNDIWTTSLSGFTDGDWSWTVEAKDTAKRGGNVAIKSASFTVSTGGGGGGGGGDVIENAEWTGGGAVQTAVGRLFYEMPSNPRRKRWAGYVCSGTVVTDNATNRSVILTASHCVYDDANKAFARNVLFIPNQAETGGTGTDSNCSNDPIGCWVADFGVVDVNWTTRTFPDNIPWDYAFYVVADSGAHEPGLSPASDALDGATDAMTVVFTDPAVNDGSAGAGTSDFTFGMGYSYSDDPNFMYCAEDMTTEGVANWWLPSCGLSGGSSGGPWLQPPTGGSGPIISVNSWGYTGSPGMAGPKLSGNSASCVKQAAIEGSFLPDASDGDAGHVVTCP